MWFDPSHSLNLSEARITNSTSFFKEVSVWSLTYQQSLFNRLYQTFIRALPTRWRRKPAGIDMELNYVTVMLWTSLVCCVCSHEISQRWKLEQFRSHDPTTQNVTMSSHNVLNFKTSELWNHISTCHLLLKFKCKMSMLCCVQYWPTAAVSVPEKAVSPIRRRVRCTTCAYRKQFHQSRFHIGPANP